MHQHIDSSTQELAALHIKHHEKVLGKVPMEHGWTDASRGLPAKFGWVQNMEVLHVKLGLTTTHIKKRPTMN